MLGCMHIRGVTIRSVNIWGGEGEGCESTGCERKVKGRDRVRGVKAGVCVNVRVCEC